MLRHVELFGKKVKVRTSACNKNGKTGGKIDYPYFNIYVRIADACNARCLFCAFRNMDKNFRFNYPKFLRVIEEIRKKALVNKVSFTGGEPTTNPLTLLKCIKHVKKRCSKTFIVVNTNGYKLSRLDDVDEINSISLSRHHYDDATNDKTFRTKTLSSERVAAFKNKHKIHLSCNLIKGLIDSRKEIVKYLEAAYSLGVNDIGFVTLMKVNRFCENKHVDFESIAFDGEDMIHNQERTNGNACRCRNYLYLPQKGNKTVKIYSRYYVDRDANIGSNLVFDGEHLRTNFGGNVIY